MFLPDFSAFFIHSSILSILLHTKEVIPYIIFLLILATLMRWLITSLWWGMILGGTITWDDVTAWVLVIYWWIWGIENEEEHIQGQYVALKSAASYYHFCMEDNEVGKKKQGTLQDKIFFTTYKDSDFVLLKCKRTFLSVNIST